MFVCAYKSKGHVLSRYATQLVNTEEVKIHLFVERVLRVICSHDLCREKF